jgi:chromodomain-helicase-DNA-binding protein 4
VHQRDEILRTARQREKSRSMNESEGTNDQRQSNPDKRVNLDIDETTEFVCGSCAKGGICMGCLETVDAPPISRQQATGDVSGSAPGRPDCDIEMADGSGPTVDAATSREHVFRCFTCKRAAHWNHLPVPSGNDGTPVSLAVHYRLGTKWLCHDCSSYTFALDKILAWRPYPKNATQPAAGATSYKSQLPREYLVKWTKRSYRRTSWVPHMWLLSTSPAKLKNFLASGSRVKLLERPAAEQAATQDDGAVAGAGDSREPSAPVDSEDSASNAPFAAADAERRIPPAWKTVDRVLDVLLWAPEKRSNTRRRAGRSHPGNPRVKHVAEDSSADDSVSTEVENQRSAAYDLGEQPDEDLTETVAEWEKRTKKQLSSEDAGLVIWAFIKWDDLGYEECTWNAQSQVYSY